MSSSRSVPTSDTRIDPMQPSLLEKHMNIAAQASQAHGIGVTPIIDAPA